MSREKQVLKASATITADENIDVAVPVWAEALVLFVDLSAVAGTTPIFDVKLQYKDPTSGQYRDTGAQFGQQTAAARGMYLAFAPGATERLGDGANRIYNYPLPTDLRIVVDVDRTTGDETYTYSCTAVWIGRRNPPSYA